MTKVVANPREEEHTTSQIPEVLEWFGDVVENYHTAIVVSFSTLFCLLLSAMFVLRQWIKTQEDAHRNCRSKAKLDILELSDGKFGSVVDRQPVPRPLVFSENVPESVLGTMPQKKADVIRMEKEIAKALTKEQRLTEAEVQRAQLEAIYDLMSKNEEKFGESSMAQIYSQASMYGK
ncbi:uncharacterized protein LOC100902917 [Galendromus occidentalis]|uniref:Uncharacterized protein LOC100902917 n=1 Tax=Galendromus occidentalis TaxID=34638 RepID=A0AAJ6QP29_9ACAR|nr:uncharacterized protein LOC100902917 [Galendromus occidentalis]